MLEELKPIRSTPTGIYFRMADGRIGYANHQYARVSVTREGIRNGEYYKEDCKVGDRMYQINGRTKCVNEYINHHTGKTAFWDGVERVRYTDIASAINALSNFNCKNCGDYAVELRKNKILKEYEEHKSLNIKSILTRDEMELSNDYSDGREFGYSEGYKLGKENGYEDGYDAGYLAQGKANQLDLDKEYEEGVASRIEARDEGYNEGFGEGIICMENKLNKLLNSL